MSFAHLVASEKGLSVWHDASGADDKITAVRLPIGELDVNRPRPLCGGVGAWGIQKVGVAWIIVLELCTRDTVPTFLRPDGLPWGAELLL